MRKSVRRMASKKENSEGNVERKKRPGNSKKEKADYGDQGSVQKPREE